MDPRPDGIFVANDNCAVSVILRLKKKASAYRKILPSSDLIMILYRRLVNRTCQQSIIPVIKWERVAAKHLIDLLNGTHSASQNEIIVLHHKLMVREIVATENSLILQSESLFHQVFRNTRNITTNSPVIQIPSIYVV